MIFNKDNDGFEEIASLTGNYYRNNDFTKIAQDIEDAQSEVCDIIGDDVYNSIEAKYINGADDRAIKLLQQPIAYLATLNHYKKNDLSHSDNGRKITIASDGTEKLPWEWQLDRDNEILLDNYYASVERLIKYLNSSDIAEWKDSEKYKESQSLLIKNGKELDHYFPVNRSERMYYILLPYLKEAQMRHVMPGYGISLDISSMTENVKYAACMAEALYAMAIAFRRGPIQLIPHAIIKGYLAEHGVMKSDAVSLEDVRRVSKALELDAEDWIEQMKVQRDGKRQEVDLLCKNDKDNKFFNL